MRETSKRRWRDYDVDQAAGSVVGTVKVLERLHSPQLGNERDLLVYLPPSYGAGDKRYPVLYMHDGQNLFDETMESVSGKGLEAIVVGIPNLGAHRLDEYSPFHAEGQGGGRGDAYIDFLSQTVKPVIDEDFRTRPERSGTGIAGSSMGGLISLYALFREPQVFGFAGVMSPALWFAGRAIFDYVSRMTYPGGKIYLDIGTEEGAEAVHDARRMHELLVSKGYRKGRDLAFVVEAGGRHEEAAWARRMRKQLMLWLDAAQPAPPST
jgi:predicted alpha/beta superfamily hydrolase